MTNSTVNRLAPTQVELEIPISRDDIAAAEDRAYRKLVKNARLPGFRKGKVPRKVFEQAYGSEAITSEAMDEVLPSAYAKAVREHDLEPVQRPKMEILETDGGRPTKLKATVEVRPEIPLHDYQGIRISRPATTISDEDVERSLLALARERATAIPVDRGAQLGDIVTIDYEGRIDGEPFEGGTAKNETTELIEGRFIPGFAAGIAGMRVGETKDVEAAFPAEYQQTDLAGKSAVFTVTLHEIKELELPALDDAFAKTVSANETIDDLRADVKRRLESIARSRERRAAGNAIMERLLQSHDFPLPESLVDGEVEHLMHDAQADAARAQLSFEQYLEKIGKTDAELRQQFQNEARERVKATLLIEHIAKRENIAATPADMQEELEAMARQYGQPVARIRKALGSNVLSLMDGIVRNKTLDFLIDHAEISASEETPASAS
jgi:trigger factor